MLSLQPASQATLLPDLGSPESSPDSYTQPLVVYLSNSIKRDVRLLAAMGAIAEPDAKVICGYLPHAFGGSDDGNDNDSAVLRALSPGAGGALSASGGAKRLARQRSETAPLRPAPSAALQPRHQLPQPTIQLQFQREQNLPRKDKTHRHEGLGARLGAFFNKLSSDSETSPRTKACASASSPRAGAKTTAQEVRVHERSLSDAPHSPQPASSRLPHRVTVSHCHSPLGIGPKHRQQLLRQDSEQQRKASHGSQRSGASSCSNSAASGTIADYSSADSSASNRSSNRSSGVSTLAARKRSFTHLGLSMESLHADRAAPSTLLLAGSRSPPLRRSKPASNIAALQPKRSPPVLSEGVARLAAPANSLGLVLQSSATLASAPRPKARPVPPPIHAQRHHAGPGAKEPKSPSRLHCGLSSIVSPRLAAPPKSAAPTMAFPPMPSDACQAAMLSDTAPPEPPRTPPSIARALSDSAGDGSLASLVLVATAAYDYASGVKGDLEFAKGERIVIQSRVNDDWWFGSILPAAGRGSTGRSGMFPRSHVALT
ncbi:hypothetical protein COEREDRAFT_81766 [Coemansia reversa NRRL 1564]|uniref:SH3 domain-containing protein n=1 Tax=Coemansia reversa (strain ATCC 12441 / NRRL 1564) TaxID=763665 RepID=A0A2G5BA06_COERN|nr:hypothetical protein COEREDRAFT_81766 [Coemansia reversa NRRL 1564]|eukprot:PIA15844.1 hypothetical protein COEREDRAFT_81766 [Coemansia reversa NRRL 1564]